MFAAGDAANAVHPFYGHRVRVEHWHNALEQDAAARAMLGDGTPYDVIPYFFSDQYEVGWTATRANGRRSCSAATWRRASSSPSGCTATASWRA